MEKNVKWNDLNHGVCMCICVCAYVCALACLDRQRKENKGGSSRASGDSL